MPVAIIKCSGILNLLHIRKYLKAATARTPANGTRTSKTPPSPKPVGGIPGGLSLSLTAAGPKGIRAILLLSVVLPNYTCLQVPGANDIYRPIGIRRNE